ncbi:MAG: TetR/AcrR family transcriptional regulator [Spirochaetes bacterium]|nr:TetR/AcrR family transcriptional regulator [Spirochaetota bacterium]
MNVKPERKVEIIDAALRLIDKKGIQNLTTRNLAREVGITEPGLYRHFRNKEDILAGILAMFRNANVVSMEELASRGGLPLDTIGALYLEKLRRFEANPSLAAVIFSEEIFRNSRKLSKEIFSIMEMTSEGIEALLRDGVKRGELPDGTPIGELALIVMGSFRMLVKRWHLSGRAFGLEKEGASLWKTLRSLLSGNAASHK